MLLSFGTTYLSRLSDCGVSSIFLVGYFIYIRQTYFFRVEDPIQGRSRETEWRHLSKLHESHSIRLKALITPMHTQPLLIY